MTPLIQIPDYALKLQRRLALTNLPDSVLATETVPVIIVDDLTQRGTAKKCMGTANILSAVGELPLVALEHATPPGERRAYDLTLTKIWVSTDNNFTVVMALTGAALPGLSAPVADTSFLDLDQAGRPATILATDSIAALPARREFWRGTVKNNEPLSVPMDLFYGLGVFQNRIFVAGLTTNRALDVTYEWTEGQ